MSIAFQDLLNHCDLALRVGKVGEAIKTLRTITPSKVIRAYRLPLARICRRCDMATLGLKLLTPVVYPETNVMDEPASGPEWAEYAALRMKIGSIEEALTILSRIDGSRVIEASLLRAYCHMARWDSAPAVRELRVYLSYRPDAYPSLVARVNLAASLISIHELSEAENLLQELIAETKAGGYDRLRANCHELRSQIHLEQGDDLQCLSDLDVASNILTFQKTTDQLYIKKWRAVLDAKRTHSQDPLIRIKKEAFSRKSWETVREMDFQLLKLNFDSKLFQYLMWGTPFIAYQERVCQVLGQSRTTVILDQYVYGDTRNLIIDLRTAEMTSGSLNAGKQVHRLLAILMQDFYRPISVGALYADLFPGDYYNVFTSPNRVHQALCRSRRWLKENHVPVVIQELGGQFALHREGPVAFVLGANAKTIDKKSAILERVRTALKHRSSFSSAHVRETSGLSSASTARFLNWAVQSEHLQKDGTGRATRYIFSKTMASAA